MATLHRGKHLLIDIKSAPIEACLDDERMLDAMIAGARKAGMRVINTVRYKFSGDDTPPGFTAFVSLDASHVSVHTYADTGQLSLCSYTCGDHDPSIIWNHIQSIYGFTDYSLRIVDRFI